MKFLAIVALLFCGAFAQEGPQCEAPNGAGLAGVLREFTAMIPMEKCLELLLTAMTSDPETQTVMEYLSSPEFYHIITAVKNQPAFENLARFACGELHFDVKYYLNVLNGILGFPEVRYAHISDQRSGFHNLLLELLGLLPVEEMKALFEEKLATDYYLQLAFQTINSDQFGTLIETLQGNFEYNDMKNRLRGLGVDVDLVIDTVSKLFRP